MKKPYLMLTAIFLLITLSLFIAGCNQTTTPKDELITECLQSYYDCKNVATQKYDISVSLLKYEKFENESEAEKFDNIWRGSSQLGLYLSLHNDFGYGTNLENIFPIILLAIKINGPGVTINPGGQVPAVLICDKSGSLTPSSKQALSCG